MRLLNLPVGLYPARTSKRSGKAFQGKRALASAARTGRTASTSPNARLLTQKMTNTDRAELMGTALKKSMASAWIGSALGY
jgi:hypothetical protein